MSKFTSAFPRGNAFLAVVHVRDVVQAKRNADIAFHEGADGIFLISHEEAVSASVLRGIYGEVRHAFPKQWTGLNFLDMEPEETVFFTPPGVSGIWEDDIGITDKAGSTGLAEHLADLRAIRRTKLNSDPLYFGGVAFKYQKPIENPAAAALLAIPLVDVITTSGNATGSAPDLAKIRAMRAAVGDDVPIGIASGMTASNVGAFAEYANCFIVATGISDSPDEFSPAKVREFAKAIPR